jgi:hypothetical protein
MKTLHSFRDCRTYILACMNSLLVVLSLTKRLGIRHNFFPLYIAFWLYLLSRSECSTHNLFNISGIYFKLLFLLAIPAHSFNHETVPIILVPQPPYLLIFLRINQSMLLSQLLHLSIEISLLSLYIIS